MCRGYLTQAGFYCVCGFSQASRKAALRLYVKERPVNSRLRKFLPSSVVRQVKTASKACYAIIALRGGKVLDGKVVDTKPTKEQVSKFAWAHFPCECVVSGVTEPTHRIAV